MNASAGSVTAGKPGDARAAMGKAPRAEVRLSMKFRARRNHEYLTVTALDAAAGRVSPGDFVRDLLVRGVAALGAARRIHNDLYAAVPGLDRLCTGDLRPPRPERYIDVEVPDRLPRGSRREASWNADGVRDIQVRLAPGYEREDVIARLARHAPTMGGREGRTLLRVAVWQGLVCLAEAEALPPGVLRAVPGLRPSRAAPDAPLQVAEPPSGAVAAEPWTLRPDSLDLPPGTPVVLTPVDPAPSLAAVRAVQETSVNDALDGLMG